ETTSVRTNAAAIRRVWNLTIACGRSSRGQRVLHGSPEARLEDRPAVCLGAGPERPGIKAQARKRVNGGAQGRRGRLVEEEAGLAGDHGLGPAALGEGDGGL